MAPSSLATGLKATSASSLRCTYGTKERIGSRGREIFERCRGLLDHGSWRPDPSEMATPVTAAWVPGALERPSGGNYKVVELWESPEGVPGMDRRDDQAQPAARRPNRRPGVHRPRPGRRARPTAARAGVSPQPAPPQELGGSGTRPGFAHRRHHHLLRSYSLTKVRYSEVLWKGTPKPGVAIAGGHAGGGVTGPGFCRSAVAGPRCGGPRGWRSRAGTGRVPRRTGAFRRGGRICRGRRSGR